MKQIQQHLVCALMIQLAACAAEAAPEDNVSASADALSEITVRAADGHEVTFLSDADHAVAAFETTSTNQPSVLRQHPGASVAGLFRFVAPESTVPEFLLAAERDSAAHATTGDRSADVIATQAALTEEDFEQNGGCNECGRIGNLDAYPHSTEYCHLGVQSSASDGSVGQEFAGSFNAHDKAAIATFAINGHQRQSPLQPNQMTTWRVSGARADGNAGVAANSMFISLQGASGATYDMSMCVAGYEDPAVIFGPQVTVGGPGAL